MTTRIRIGLLTPSSNTVMEPRVGDLLRDIPDVSAHFGRFRVTQINMGEKALGQFTFEPQLAAADLLADAKCDVIAWGGTSGGWLGLENDRQLCRAITERTGVPSTTSTLATLDGFHALGVKTYGLVTPYLDEVQRAILPNFAKDGFQCIAERHLEDAGNYSFALYDEAIVADLIREVAAARPDAIAVYCTNFNGTGVAGEVETETGVPVLDSISATIWHALKLLGHETSTAAHWGRIFLQDLPKKAAGDRRSAQA